MAHASAAPPWQSKRQITEAEVVVRGGGGGSALEMCATTLGGAAGRADGAGRGGAAGRHGGGTGRSFEKRRERRAGGREGVLSMLPRDAHAGPHPNYDSGWNGMVASTPARIHARGAGPNRSEEAVLCGGSRTISLRNAGRQEWLSRASCPLRSGGGRERLSHESLSRYDDGHESLMDCVSAGPVDGNGRGGGDSRAAAEERAGAGGERGKGRTGRRAMTDGTAAGTATAWAAPRGFAIEMRGAAARWPGPGIGFECDWRGQDADPRRRTEVRLAWTMETLFLRFDCRYRTPTVFPAAAGVAGRHMGLWERDVAEAFLRPEPRRGVGGVDRPGAAALDGGAGHPDAGAHARVRSGAAVAGEFLSRRGRARAARLLRLAADRHAAAAVPRARRLRPAALRAGRRRRRLSIERTLDAPRRARSAAGAAGGAAEARAPGPPAVLRAVAQRRCRRAGAAAAAGRVRQMGRRAARGKIAGNRAFARPTVRRLAAAAGA